ncbi:hypothetical protein PISL3812_09690 [Talaromyces islandicus]|uniref:Uncharacterized protein n=1 Tax=Talaromyces islandicus TaxID=28573 RepID=A0A0U1MAH1_TALIS|nr:hypothetical protein PISL3812_09690 [Talaromyces islandicus]
MPTAAPLQGWQYDDSSRSSWDILWSYLTVIFACTWTALHLGVPRRASTGRIISKKAIYWFLTVLYPELLLIAPAADDYLKAKMTLARFKAAQADVDKKNEQMRRSPNATQLQPSYSEGEEETSNPVKWTMVHAFCVNMRSLALRTADSHIYTVQSKQVKTLVKCGIIKYPQFSERDIKDRSKADSLAKVVSLIQSTWAVVNVVSRAAYHLPITLLEIATMAFILYAYSSYAFWWNKPKDINAPIIIHLPYRHDSDEMAPELRSILDEKREEWIQYKPSPAEKESWVIWRLLVMICKNPIQTIHIFKDRIGSLSQQKPEDQAGAPRPEDVPPRETFSLSEEILNNFVVFFVSLGFSAIHIAA